MEPGWPTLEVPICLDCLLAHPTEKLDSRQAGAGGMALEVPDSSGSLHTESLEDKQFLKVITQEKNRV